MVFLTLISSLRPDWTLPSRTQLILENVETNAKNDNLSKEADDTFSSAKKDVLDPPLLQCFNNASASKEGTDIDTMFARAAGNLTKNNASILWLDEGSENVCTASLNNSTNRCRAIEMALLVKQSIYKTQPSISELMQLHIPSSDRHTGFTREANATNFTRSSEIRSLHLKETNYSSFDHRKSSPARLPESVSSKSTSSSVSTCNLDRVTTRSSTVSWSEGPYLPRTLFHIDVRKMSVGEIKLDRCADGLLVLGTGTYGTALKGKLVKTGEPVVVKRISRRQTPRHAVYREARIMQHLHDTGVVPAVHGVTQYSKASLCLVQEFRHGKTLHELIHKHFTEFSIQEWLSVCYQMTLGLLAIHERLVCHNDIKADNIIVNFPDGKITVSYIDFGMATYRCNHAVSFDPAQVGDFPFLAPEVKDGQPNSAASDVYGLGYIFLQIRIKGVPSLARLAKMCLQNDSTKRPCPVVIAMELEDLLVQSEKT